MNTEFRSRRIGLLLLCLLLDGSAPLLAQSSPTLPATPLSVTPGKRIVLASGACVVAVDPAAGPVVEIARVSDTRQHAIYNAPSASSTTPVTVVVETGAKATTDGKACEQPTRLRFDITVAQTPDIPPGALEQAFRILMTAFVLAVLLESAFALIFNWRLYLEFFVGKAWKTPIMFVGALMVVSTFDLDLMQRLFGAYSPTSAPPSGYGVWFTRAITAMILAGGSVGVNRVLVALGFRSQLRAEEVAPKLETHEAFVSVRVFGERTTEYQVNMDALDPIPADTPTVLGFTGAANGLGARLRDLLFPIRSRIPRSGGLRVSTTKAYRISVTDLRDGRHYDTRGKVIEQPSASQALGFAPKAIVDLAIRIQDPSTQ